MAEDHLLGGAPAEQHRHLVLELGARHQEPVLRRALNRVAQRSHAARDDRDLVHRVGAGQRHRDDRVAHLVMRDDAPLGGIQHAIALLQPGDQPLDRLREVIERHRIGAAARGEQCRLVHQVGEIGAREARRQRRNLL